MYFGQDTEENRAMYEHLYNKEALIEKRRKRIHRKMQIAYVGLLLLVLGGLLFGCADIEKKLCGTAQHYCEEK